MGFFFFLLVNATLFVRPMEIVPDLEGLHLYEFLILASLLLSLPEILHYFSSRPLSHQPITLCVFGLFLATLLPQVADPELGLRHAEHFGKVLVYYVLAVSLLNSPGRLRIFLAWLIFCFLLLSGLTILQYHDVIQLSQLTVLTDYETDKLTGAMVKVRRLQGTGIFWDPNEFCGILAVAAPLCIWGVTSRSNALKCLSLVVLILVLYGIALTGSRGGFLGLLAGLGALAYARYGLKKALLLGLAGTPLLLLVFAGRQTEISVSSGTGQTRIQLWSDWLYRFRESPLTGNGLTVPKEEGEKKSVWETGHLAHNSYIQAFADWGLFGGTLFIGAFFLTIWGVDRYRADRTLLLDPHLRRLQPFVLGVLAAYAVGILSLSMTDRVPTYLMFALGCVFPLLARSAPPLAPPSLTGRMAAGILGLSLAFLACTYVFVRVFVNW